MSEIPVWFWMLLLGGLSTMFGLILYYVAMLIRESVMTLREFRYILVELHDVLDAGKLFIEKINRATDMVSGVIEKVSTTVLRPLAMFSSIFGMVKKFTGEKEN